MCLGKGLLMHWWHYYGKYIYNYEELLKFEKIIDKYGIDKVIEIAVASYVVSDGSPTILLASIRSNRVDEMIASLPNIESFSEEGKAEYLKAKEDFIKIISESYETYA